MKETGLKRLLLFSSTIVIIIITSIVSYFLIVIENRNFEQETKRIEKELLDNKKRYLENRLKMIIKEINFDRTFIKKFELDKVDSYVNAISKTLNTVETKNLKVIKKILNGYNTNNDIKPFVFFGDGTLFWNPNNPKTEGKNYFDFEDINGFKYVKDMIIRAKSNNHTSRHHIWYLPNSSVLSNSTAFVKYVPRLNLVVGAYISKESIETTIKNTILEKLSKYKFDKDSFLYVDYFKSYNMSDNVSKSLLHLGDKESLISLEDKTLKKQITDIFLTNGFNGIYSKNIEYKDTHYLIYTSLLNQYKWIIGIGENLKELYKTKELKKQISEQNLNSKISNLIFLSIITAIFFFIISIFLVKKIEKILINHQKRADIESNKYQALYQYSNDSFLLANESYKIIDANPKSTTLSNLSKEELLSESLKNLFPQIDFEKVQTQKSGYYRTVFKDALENKKTVEFTFVWLDMENEKIIFASIRDITERINLLNEKREQEQILIQQSKMAAMGEMIGNIAHQWRQPLSQISGLFMDIASAYSYKELDDKYLHTVINEANDIIEYMSHTIDDFRNFFNPNKPKENFLASKALENAIKIIKSSFDFQGINIQKTVKSENPIYGYPNEYSQVILNILSNAKDIFVERNIKNPQIIIEINKAENKTCLTISDNAGGIEQKSLERIFEPYFTTKYDYGTGIGLYMSKIIIEKNIGGTISVSNSELGATFTICI
ncbi:cache domain-containing protein [Arcobacter sp.]|uniref:cache domain-containing protein n=1 Tax=Arcobacter sp. TaxID=1872629 RepID=UPI003D1469CB